MKIVLNVLTYFLIFIASAVVIILASYPYDIEGYSHGARLVTIFVFVYLLTMVFLKAFGKILSDKNIIITFLTPFILFVIITLFVSSIRNSVKISPIYITWVLGLMGGIFHYKRGFNLKNLLILAVFPVIMTFNLYDLWRHKMEYGTFTGHIEKAETIAFEFLDKEGNIVSSQDLRGDVVLLDFWFIHCPTCWEAFPEVQKVYDNYKNTPLFKLYSVNRSDDPEKLFKKIEDKGYTFPVLRGSKDQMESLGVYFYPTVLIINRKGEVVFRGEIENAKMILQELLK